MIFFNERKHILEMATKESQKKKIQKRTEATIPLKKIIKFNKVFPNQKDRGRF